MDTHKNILNSTNLNSTPLPIPMVQDSMTPPSVHMNDMNILENFNNKKKILIKALDSKRNVSFRLEINLNIGQHERILLFNKQTKFFKRQGGAYRSEDLDKGVY